MSTVQKVNFEPVSDILPVWRKDLPLADKTIAEPLNSVALVDGEWMTLNSSYQWVRPADVSSVGARAAIRSFLCFFERGRTDRAGMAEKKTTMLYLGHYEGDTRIFDAAAAFGSGAAITFVLQPLKVATITLGSRNYSGLVGHGGSGDTDPVVGYVTKLPNSNGGKLRFINGFRS